MKVQTKVTKAYKHKLEMRKLKEIQKNLSKLNRLKIKTLDRLETLNQPENSQSKNDLKESDRNIYYKKEKEVERQKQMQLKTLKTTKNTLLRKILKKNMHPRTQSREIYMQKSEAN